MANLILPFALFVLAFEVVTALSVVQAPEPEVISDNFCDPSQCYCPQPVCSCPISPVVDEVSVASDTIQPAQTLGEQPAADTEVNPAIQLDKPILLPKPAQINRRPRLCVCPPCPEIFCMCPLELS